MIACNSIRIRGYVWVCSFPTVIYAVSCLRLKKSGLQKSSLTAKTTRKTWKKSRLFQLSFNPIPKRLKVSLRLRPHSMSLRRKSQFTLKLILESLAWMVVSRCYSSQKKRWNLLQRRTFTINSSLLTTWSTQARR
jgi:hypothetical protein